MTTAYDDLPIVPDVVAHVVAERPYVGDEYSEKSRDPSFIARIENARSQMSSDDVVNFCFFVDFRCRKAYKAESKWFMECVDGDNASRDQFYVWVTHWLASYLQDPDAFSLKSFTHFP